MSLAIATGVAPRVWLADPAAMATAVRLFEDQDRELKRRKR